MARSNGEYMHRSRLRPGPPSVGFVLLLWFATFTGQAAAEETRTSASLVSVGEELWVPSKVFQQQRRVQVYLPSGYDSSQARYPVLYLLDGDAYYVSVAGMVRQLSESSGRIPETIVVSIPNVARARELAPPLSHPQPKEEPFAADVFHRFLEEDLIPWVETRYRTQPFRLIVGHSRGGLFALYTLLNWPDTFDAYLALSPALWWDDESLVRDAPDKLRALRPGRSTRFLYLSAGHESTEITEPAARIAKLLEQARPAGLQWRYDYLEKENHMSSHLPGTYAGLQMVFADLQVPEAVILSQGLAGVESHYAGLKKTYGFELRPSHAMLSWIGGFLEQQGRPKEAAAFFARAEELYPKHQPLLRDWPAKETANALRVDRNVFVTMRDGTRLATDLYLPTQTEPKPMPVVLIRTPYGKDMRYTPQASQPNSLLRFFVSNGYAVAVQDKRGRHRSEGTYVVSGGDAQDGYDTVDWLSKQSWSSGKVGAVGCSYEGDIQLFMAGTRPPALKALIPMASGSAVGSLGGQYRYFGARIGGVPEWVGVVGWFAQYGEKVFPKLPADLPHDQYNANAALWEITRRSPTIDLAKAWHHLPSKEALAAQGMTGTDFEDTIARPNTDPYWQDLPYMTASYVSDVPALFVNSWYDFGADMTLFEMNYLRRHSASPLARDNQFAIMSPHTHCAFEREASESTRVGERDMGDTRFDYRNQYLTWFDAWLKDDAAAKRRIRQWPRLRYYAMGRNKWQSASAWPLPGTSQQDFYLGSGGRANSLAGNGTLSRRPNKPPTLASTFTYDPNDPVPSRGGAICCTGTPDAVPGALDQRPVEARDDVLVFSSDALEREIEVTGDVKLVLYASSDAVDTDFTAKLIDVHPDGRAFNVLESVLRVRYREGQDREVWMRPNEVYELTLLLGATSNVFLPGHRVRLEVSSSNFPRWERNMNRGGVNAEQRSGVPARNTVHHSASHPSRLVLPVVARK